MSNLNASLRKRQHGISLVIVMIFLVILSILGITAIQGSTLSSRIARNEADRNLAFQAAEAALHDAEQDIKGLRFDNAVCQAGTTGCRAQAIKRGDNFVAACTNGLCDSAGLTPPVWEDRTKWVSGGGNVPYGTYTGATALPNVFQKPSYLIEYFPLGDAVVYRVTAVGYGASQSTQIMLQTSVKALPI